MMTIIEDRCSVDWRRSNHIQWDLFMLEHGFQFDKLEDFIGFTAHYFDTNSVEAIKQFGNWLKKPDDGLPTSTDLLTNIAYYYLTKEVPGFDTFIGDKCDYHAERSICDFVRLITFEDLVAVQQEMKDKYQQYRAIVEEVGCQDNPNICVFIFEMMKRYRSRTQAMQCDIERLKIVHDQIPKEAHSWYVFSVKVCNAAMESDDSVACKSCSKHKLGGQLSLAC
jgi:hypothetical protein